MRPSNSFGAFDRLFECVCTVKWNYVPSNLEKRYSHNMVPDLARSKLALADCGTDDRSRRSSVKKSRWKQALCAMLLLETH
jgi:hypothetical protein